MGVVLPEKGVTLNEEAGPTVPPSPQSPPQPPPPTLRREWLLLALSVLVLVAIVAPPLVNLGRYQHRIVDTMSRSLGREVTLRSVSLRLLPWPALVLSDVVVNEEPEFGAEPALRAPSVIAQLRLASLWRGRLEVSRVEMSDASLNLVRNAAGRWNVGAILLQASHVSNAPTGQRRAGPAPRFPYIEITDSRVNLKQGVEKLPYSLTNANLSMWLAEPELYRLRLDGQPVRTDVDLGLSDTGILRITGSLHRATALGRMPLALHGEWVNAPLGQASRLLLGSDRGWRGDLRATADVSGDLDNLAIKTHMLIANLHREEFTPAEAFAVDTTCQAAYRRADRELRDISCRWPVGDGQLLLAGGVSAGTVPAAPMGRETTLALTVQRLPASFLVAAAGLVRSDFAPGFHLEGALNGMLFYNAHAGEMPVYAGLLEAPQLRLVADGLREPLELSETRVAAATPTPSGVSTLVLTAAPLDLDGPVPATVNAQITSQGFLLHASGSASLARLGALGRTTHLLPPALAWLGPQGTAEFDVTRSAAWQQQEDSAALPGDFPAPSAAGLNLSSGPASRSDSGLAASRNPVAVEESTVAVTNGWLRLRGASYRPRFLPEAVSLPEAQATFLPRGIAWSVPEAMFHQVPLQITASYPLNCAGQPDCVTRFRAVCSSLDGEALASALLGIGADRPLLDTLLDSLNSSVTRWPALDGAVHADTFTLGRLVLRDADATLSIADGRARLLSLDATALGGALHGEGVLRLEKGVPIYQLSTALTRANASGAGALFHENWGGGALSFSSQLQLTGSSAEQLANSAKGSFHAEWTRGGLGTQTPLARFAVWAADGRIENHGLTLVRGQLTTASTGELLPLSGTIAFDRALALHIQPAPAPVGTSTGKSITVTGTLPRPAE